MCEVNDFLNERYNKTKQIDISWYDKNIIPVLEEGQRKNFRDVDKLIKMAEHLHDMLTEKRPLPIKVPPIPVEVEETTDFMRPVDPKLTDILMKATEKGATDRYLHERYKTKPEDRFYFRGCTSWDYGWQHHLSKLNDDNPFFGRSQIIKNSFYRKNNVGPDAKHYRVPLAAEPGTCNFE